MPEGTVSSYHASLCWGKRRQWAVGSVGVCPMRSQKGNGLDKGSSNKTAVLKTVGTGERLCCLWRICQVISDFSAPCKATHTMDEVPLHYWYVSTAVNISPSICLWSSLYVPFYEQTTLNTEPIWSRSPFTNWLMQIDLNHYTDVQ